MKELEYPFDAEKIIAEKKRLRKKILAERNDFLPQKIAILGGATTGDIKLILELFLLDYGIQPEFYESSYNQFYQEAVFPNAPLEEFAPDLIYVCTFNRNISRYPVMTDSIEVIEQLLSKEMEKYTAVWENLFDKYGCPIIQNNFEMPYYRLLGNKDAYDIHGAVNFLSRLNMKFCEYAQEHENFYICDLQYISADYGLAAWSDPFYWYMYKYAVAVPAIPYLSYNVANIIKSLLGKNKKGFVLDLDNTLWGGVIGDDGLENIKLGVEDPKGQAYYEFQRYIKAHQQLGILLNIDSKNDYDNAVLGINHPDSAFQVEDFISIKANWNPKDQNLLEIAADINLLPESLVFIDDNPAERHIVEEQLKGVRAPALTDIAHYIGIIDRSGFFESTTISQDDLERNEMYRKNMERLQLKATFADYGAYLKSLDMRAVIRAFEPVYMSRIAQLTNKSNQFNLTTRRYTQAEIEKVAADSSYITLYGKLKDKFGDNGVVSLVIGQLVDCICHIDLWVMSCRVLKRDMELAMMDELARKCQECGVDQIMGYYYPTVKNHMVADFYGMVQGFENISQDDNGNSVWKLDLSSGYKNKNKYIKVNEED